MSNRSKAAHFTVYRSNLPSITCNKEFHPWDVKRNERLLIHLRSSVTEYAVVRSSGQISATYRELLELREAYGQIRADIMDIWLPNIDPFVRCQATVSRYQMLESLSLVLLEIFVEKRLNNR